MRRTWCVAGVAMVVLGCSDSTEPSAGPQDAVPTAEPELLTATNLYFGQISAGYNHSCGRTMSGGKLYCWGNNSYGQLGNATLNNKKRPTAVSSSLQFVWVSAGAGHTCAIATDSKAYCWGLNSSGQLGDGTYTDQWSPKLVAGGLSWKQIEVGGGYAYAGFTCGLTMGGKIYCWGYNSSGQLGNGSAYYGGDSYPTATSDIGVTYRQVTTGGYHACAVSTTNVAYCWGEASYGQTGNGGIFYEPTAVRGGLAFRSVNAGQSHTCGTTTSNKAYCWGYGFDGALGNGTTTNRFSPRAVSGGLSFSRVFASASHSCGLTAGNKAYCWGSNDNGQLGDGTTTKRLAPVPVKGGLLFFQLGSHGYHTCAATVTVGVGYCWGYNGDGEIGDATTTTPRLKPTRIAGAL
jgi:alpha-tubulin suppressor-like RCC1 family protein